MDRLEELTGSARLQELRRKMEEVRRANDAEKRRLTEILSSSDIDLESLEPATPINRAASPITVIGRRGLEPKRHDSSPEVARPGQFHSPPMSHSAPTSSFVPKTRTDSGLRLKPEPRVSPSSSPLAGVASTGMPDPPAAELTEDEIKMKKRSNVVLEIVNTEKDYVQDLCAIRDVYCKYLDRERVVSTEHLNNIFSNVEQLYEVNNQLFLQMEERRASTSDPAVIMLGDLFLNFSDLFKVYTPYFINHPTAEATVRELTETNRVFADFLNHQQFNNVARTRGLTIFMFLIKPIQRICKYPLLLRELLKYTPTTHADIANLNAASQKIEELVNFLNEKKRDKEAAQKVAEIASAMEGLDTPIVNPTRRFLLEAQLSLVKGNQVKKRTVFLLNDLLLFSKMKPQGKLGAPPRYIFKHMMPMSTVRVLDIADRPGYCYLIGICPKDSDIQQNYMCSSNDEKQTWLTALKKIIRDFQIKEVEARKGTGGSLPNSPLTASAKAAARKK